MKKTETYMPISIILRNHENQASTLFPMLIPYEYTDEELVDFVMGPNCLNPEYAGKFRQVNNMYSRMQHLNPVLQEKTDTQSTKAMMRDVCSTFCIFNIWEKQKKVYKLDAEFFKELCVTKDLTIHKDYFRYVPFKCVYIDLSECKGIEPYHGAFVYVYEGKTGCQLAMHMITMQKTVYSYYTDFEYDENGTYKVPSELNPYVTFYDLLTEEKKREFKEHDHRSEVIHAILQVLMFLSTPEPDLQENEITKRTYKPSATVKNRFSEVQMWDVGVRYGAAIRIAKKEAEKVAENAENKKTDDEHTDENPKTPRKSPRPHVRSAHWQRFRIGPGRVDVRLNWVPPTFVCGNKELPVMIQKIKK